MQLTRIHKIAIAGGGMFLFSIIFQTAILPAVLNSQVRRKVALKKGWMMRDVWGKFPFAMELSFYMFNVTNPDAIKSGEKPIMQEIGPYVYNQWQEKTNQVDHEEDDTVSFTFRNTYNFNTEKTKGVTGDEEIIVPNYFILGLVNIVMRDKPSAMPIVGKAIDSIFRKPDSIFMKAKVKDILFDGLPYDCNVKDFAGSAICNELRNMHEDYGMKMVGENKYLLSLWGSRNATDAPATTRVYRGLKNINDVGKVMEYNNKPNISIWEDEYCDTFNGTDGTIFHPFFDKNGRDPLNAFNQGLCRSISCYFESRTKFAGLKMLRYTADVGSDGNSNPQHKCYCVAPDRCLKKGAFDAYKCLNIPLVITNPHFYMADPYYVEQLVGIKPDKEKHMIAIDIDPFTGSPMRAHTRAQFNMQIFKIEKFKLMKNFPDAILPLFWIDEYTLLPDFLIKEIKNGHRLYTLGLTFQYLMMFGGLGLGGFAGFLYYQSTRAENKLDSKKTGQQKDDSQLNSAEKKMPMNISALQAAQVPPNVD